MATIKKAVVKKAQKGLRCPRPTRDSGPGLKERFQNKINEGIERREIRRTERQIKKEETPAPTSFKGALGDSKPPKLAINYKEKERKAGGRFGVDSAKKGTKLSKSMKTGGKMIKKSPKKK